MPYCVGICPNRKREVQQVLCELKNTPRVVGVKQLRKALAEGRITKVFLAEDADPALTESIAQQCAQSGVALETVPTMAELGAACSIAVGAAAAGLLRE